MDRVLYRASGLPVFQNVTFRTRQKALSAPRGDVELIVDGATGLVRNAAFDRSIIAYDENYQNEQSLSPSFQQHLSSVIEIVKRQFTAMRIVEVGCGKGHFVDLMRINGLSVTGMDPAYEGNDPHIKKALFVPESDVSCEAIVLRHVLEHIEDPVQFLHGLRDANSGKGLIYIEVPCFDWICRNRAWFDIFYEHVNYFRLSDFHRIFGRVLEAGRLFGGQYLYAVADLATVRMPEFATAADVEFPSDFESFRSKYSNLPDAPRAIWGAASKGVIFAIQLENFGKKADAAIDINPAKQGSYLPCTGLQVISPDDAIRDIPAGSQVFVMNSNYLIEIRDFCRGRFDLVAVDRIA